ncbi:MAG TPA: hypothetical protein VF342_06510 [Alphaproteobacteria bacterium]
MAFSFGSKRASLLLSASIFGLALAASPLSDDFHSGSAETQVAHAKGGGGGHGGGGRGGGPGGGSGGSGGHGGSGGSSASGGGSSGGGGSGGSGGGGSGGGGQGGAGGGAAGGGIGGIGGAIGSAIGGAIGGALGGHGGGSAGSAGSGGGSGGGGSGGGGKGGSGSSASSGGSGGGRGGSDGGAGAGAAGGGHGSGIGGAGGLGGLGGIGGATGSGSSGGSSSSGRGGGGGSSVGSGTAGNSGSGAGTSSVGTGTGSVGGGASSASSGSTSGGDASRPSPDFDMGGQSQPFATAPDRSGEDPADDFGTGAAGGGSGGRPPAIALASAGEGPSGAADAPASDASAIADAVRGRVVVAAFTSARHGEGVAEVVYYRRDGTGYVYRLAKQEPRLETFRWQIRSRGAGGSSYAFVSRNGDDDGAAVTLAQENQRLAFSDTRYGPHFAFGVIQGCWPGFMPVRPPTVAVCNADADGTTLRRLEMEQIAVAAMRRGYQRRPDPGAFTTRPGTIYTNSLGNTITVTGVVGRTVRFVDQNGKEFSSHALLYAQNPKVIGNESVIAAIDSLWPLEVGKQAEAWVYNPDWSWKLTWKVLGRETVNVPAGSFDAWLIEHTEASMGDYYIGKSQTWYAPEVGWNVRYRGWVEVGTRGEETEWVLTGAHLVPP